MQLNKFYLVMVQQDSYLEPKKVFLNLEEAINYGLKLFNKYIIKDQDIEVMLYSQTISKNGTFKYERHLGSTLIRDIEDDIRNNYD